MKDNQPSGKTKKVDVVKVVNHGDVFNIPENMSLDRAMRVLQQEKEYRDAVVEVHAPIDGFVPDAAHAFFQALKATYGWAHNVTKPPAHFFDEAHHPSLLQIPVGLNETVSVPWGTIVVPGLQGYLETAVERLPDGRHRMVITGQVKRRDEPKVQEIVNRTKTYLREHSIYRGKAFRLRLKDDAGRPVATPEPTFISINPNLRNELVFSRDVEAAIAVNVFTPIQHTKIVRGLKVPLKRGILLSGKFGTGKSMTSTVVADLAVENGWTFIMCDRATELADILRLAREYGPAVVFCEDIDRVMNGERDISIDEILNVIDGVEAKNSELMVILTTNNVEQITRAMLRPGRLDAVIDIKPPDAEAADRLMRLYSRGLIAADEDISEAAREVDGQIPAVIQEVVEKSKLAAVHRNPHTEWIPGAITGVDLMAAALSMRNQIELLNGKEPDARSEYVKAADINATAILEAARIRAGESNGVLHAEPSRI